MKQLRELEVGSGDTGGTIQRKDEPTESGISEVVVQSK